MSNRFKEHQVNAGRFEAKTIIITAGINAAHPAKKDNQVLIVKGRGAEDVSNWDLPVASVGIPHAARAIEQVQALAPAQPSDENAILTAAAQLAVQEMLYKEYSLQLPPETLQFLQTVETIVDGCPVSTFYFLAELLFKPTVIVGSESEGVAWLSATDAAMSSMVPPTTIPLITEAQKRLLLIPLVKHNTPQELLEAAKNECKKPEEQAIIELLYHIIQVLTHMMHLSELEKRIDLPMSPAISTIFPAETNAGLHKDQRTIKKFLKRGNLRIAQDITSEIIYSCNTAAALLEAHISELIKKRALPKSVLIRRYLAEQSMPVHVRFLLSLQAQYESLQERLSRLSNSTSTTESPINPEMMFDGIRGTILLVQHLHHISSTITDEWEPNKYMQLVQVLITLISASNPIIGIPSDKVQIFTAAHMRTLTEK